MKVTRLRQVRKARGMTQAQLAQKVGVTQPYIAAIEQGDRTPTREVVRRVAGVLNVQIGELLGEPVSKGGAMQITQVSESTIRRQALRQGYIVRKSRRAESPENLGLYMVLDQSGNYPVFGWRYDATLEDIHEWLTS